MRDELEALRREIKDRAGGIVEALQQAKENVQELQASKTDAEAALWKR